MAHDGLTDDQVEGLLYACNLVTAYLLARVTGSASTEEFVIEQIRGAWPRVQALLGARGEVAMDCADGGDGLYDGTFLAHL